MLKKNSEEMQNTVKDLLTVTPSSSPATHTQTHTHIHKPFTKVPCSDCFIEEANFLKANNSSAT